MGVLPAIGLGASLEQSIKVDVNKAIAKDWPTIVNGRVEPSLEQIIADNEEMLDIPCPKCEVGRTGNPLIPGGCTEHNHCAAEVCSASQICLDVEGVDENLVAKDGVTHHCRRCPAGSAPRYAGATKCTPCQKGEFGADGRPCAPCPADTYQPLSNQTACLAASLPCARGQYTSRSVPCNRGVAEHEPAS